MEHLAPSIRLFLPSENGMHSAHPMSPIPSGCAKSIESEIEKLITQSNYPCVAAIAAFRQKEYQIGLYEKFGHGSCWKDLRGDLLYFLHQQKTTKAPFLSFFAVFQTDAFEEEEFEKRLWNELSYLTSEEDKNKDWSPEATQDPESKAFCFSLGGAAFFVVGLHSNSSRVSRKFRYPTLIFNVFEQFTDLQAAGKYESMVKTNRAREVKFENSVNPMVAAHGETWETIQFSGKSNPEGWKCPFRFMKTSEKPNRERPLVHAPALQGELAG